MLREGLTPFLTAGQGISAMRLTLQTQSLLAAWLATIAFETSLAGAEIVPSDRAPAQSCVSLLPPEVIETEGGSLAPIASLTGWAAAAGRLAMRDDDLPDPPDVDQSVPSVLPLPSTGRLRAGLLLLCAGSASLGLWLAFGFRRPSRSVTVVATARRSDEGEFLKGLIANSLLVIEEALLFPRMARLHGLPMASERYRVDAAHPVGDPHFPPVPAEAPAEKPAERPVDADFVHWISAPESGVRIPTYRRHGTGLAEREMAFVEGAD